MTSNWDTLKAKSDYHFDPMVQDRQSDMITYLGHVIPDNEWRQAVTDIIAGARPATWATRGYKGPNGIAPPADIAAEEYDLVRAGMSKDLPITHLNWTIPPCLKRLSDRFGLSDCMERIHVQMPGEMWSLHIDKLNKWNPDDPNSVIRIFIALTDWQPGQFWQYGNYNYSQWQAGEITTFDWKNIPHCTANAGFHPRVTFQLTGVRTAKTQEMLDWLAYRST